MKSRTVSRLLPLLFLLGLPLSPRAEEAVDTQIDERVLIEKGVRILAHRANYFLPFAYNASPNGRPFREVDAVELDNVEAKFQLSFKSPIAEPFYHDRAQLFFGYTQLCLWQLYNRETSSPFRDTNYEPEGFVEIDRDGHWGPFRSRAIRWGIVHQSNGRALPVSRSWNRVYVEFLGEHRRMSFSLKPWIRIPEPSDEDNNPDISHYMGYEELRVAFYRRKNIVSALLRNNLSLTNNKGALELTWSFPLSRYLRGFVQAFSGYGESLIDYNHHNNRLGLGFALTDWR